MRLESPSVARISAHTARRMRALSWLLVTVAIVAPAAATIGSVTPDVLWASVWFGAGTFILAVAIAAWFHGGAVAGRRHRGRPAVLEVEANGLRLGDETVRAADVIEGFCEEYGAHRQVVLQLAHETWAIEVQSAADGDGILDAVGVGLFQRAVTLQIGAITTRAGRAAIAIVVAVAALFALPLTLIFVLAFAGVVLSVQGWEWPHALGSFVFLAIALGVTLGGVRMLGVRTLRIGRDGVAVKLGLAPAAFVPFRGMLVERQGRVLTMTAGLARAALPTTGVDEATALGRRIEEARSAFDARSAVRAELLARHGRPLDAWREDIRRLAVADGYRDGIGRDDLLSIVEDPSALPDERLAAASALGALPDEPRVRVRLAAAIATTVEPKLRVALERAVEGVIDEGLLEDAIARHERR